MAGAGYKLFNTGDVLTAAQVNTYLMEQTVMVFADAAARTAALSGVVSEGMISYLKDTNAVEVYNGSAWVASDDPNAIQNTIVDAKGDLITATAADTPARIAVGNNGESLVADSSTSTGLRWQGNFAAGKNKIINGDFGIWQRGTSFTNPSNSTYTADRFYISRSSASGTLSRQTFTAGAAPVAGYEGKYFLRWSQTGSGSQTCALGQPVEDVQTFAGQTITLSFWAKASNAITVTPNFYQVFGSGGSGTVTTTGSSVNLTSSWVRYSITVSIPSISGKTVGTNSGLFLELNWGSGTTTDMDFWGVQLEAGNTATAFQTATGTLAGELSACQRYYFRNNATSVYGYMGNGMGVNSTSALVTVPFPVPMRTAPISIDYATVRLQDTVSGLAITNLTIDHTSQNMAGLTATVASGAVQYRPVFLTANNSTSAYVGFNAEL